jgi:hypothetical protein
MEDKLTELGIQLSEKSFGISKWHDRTRWDIMSENGN